jgi:hypothetical protein
MHAEKSSTMRFGMRELKLTNLSKVFFPGPGLTKGEAISVMAGEGLPVVRGILRLAIPAAVGAGGAPRLVGRCATSGTPTPAPGSGSPHILSGFVSIALGAWGLRMRATPRR